MIRHFLSFRRASQQSCCALQTQGIGAPYRRNNVTAQLNKGGSEVIIGFSGNACSALCVLSQM